MVPTHPLVLCIVSMMHIHLATVTGTSVFFKSPPLLLPFIPSSSSLARRRQSTAHRHSVKHQRKGFHIHLLIHFSQQCQGWQGRNKDPQLKDDATGAEGSVNPQTHSCGHDSGPVLSTSQILSFSRLPHLLLAHSGLSLEPSGPSTARELRFHAGVQAQPAPKQREKLRSICKVCFFINTTCSSSPLYLGS